MTNALETLKRIKAVLGLEIKLEQMKLENGAVIEADKFEAGESVFIVSEDEKVALPVGEFELEDGRILKVEEEGVIASIGEVKDDEKDEDKDKEEVEEEVEQNETEMEEDKKEMEYVSREEFSVALDEIKAAIDEIKAGYDKKEMSEEVEETNEEVIEENNEELSEEVSEEVAETDEQKELNEELSKPAVQPFKHSPEKVADREMVRFAQNKPKSILDTVFEKLNK
jgi:hypothetical protein